MHDNAIAKALAAQGHDIQLVPTYTPIRTDEEDASVDQVFFGGINVFLQQKIPLLRLVPAFLDRFLDNPWLIRKATSRSIDMKPEALGSLAVSMLKGMQGNQRKEVRRLCKWLAETAKPEVVIFTNALIGGCIPEIKKQTTAKVLVTLQGDDVFLDSLPKKYRDDCISQITRIASDIDGKTTATTTSASLTVTRLSGDAHLINTRGKISASALAGGDLRIENSFGPIYAETDARTIECKNQNGEIEVHLTNAEFKSVQMSTQFNDLVATVPDRITPNLNLDAGGGMIESEFETSSAIDAPVIQLATEKGNVILKKSGLY